MDDEKDLRVLSRKWDAASAKLVGECGRTGSLLMLAAKKCKPQDLKPLIDSAENNYSNALLSLEESLYWLTRLNDDLEKRCSQS